MSPRRYHAQDYLLQQQNRLCANLVLVVQVIALSGILELYLHEIALSDILGRITEPVVAHEFLVLTISAVGTYVLFLIFQASIVYLA